VNIFVDVIQRVIGTGVQVGIHLWFLCVVFKNRKRRFGGSYWTVIGMAGFCTLAAAMLLPKLLPYVSGKVLFVTAFCLLAIVPCRILYQGGITEFVFCFFITQSYIDNCFLVTKVVQSMCGNTFMKLSLSYMVVEGLLFVVTMPAVLWFMKYRLRVLVDTTKGMEFWNYIWLLPVALYVVYRVGISQDYTSLSQVWERMNLTVPISWIIGTLLIYIIVVGTLIDTVHSVEERERLEAVNQQLLMQQEQYEIIQQNIDETKRVRHDLHHQILDLKGFVDREDMDGIRKYLYAHLEELHLNEPALYCSNYAINTIIQYYVDLAKKDEIVVLVNLELSNSLPCSQSDLIVIFGRLLEYAVEVNRKKTGDRCLIELKSRMQGNDILVIYVKTGGGLAGNPDGDFTYGKLSETLQSKMASVVRIAEKYHGVTRLEQESGEFQGYVLLNRVPAER
jgi:two-component system sensor histidine kinase AgrC